MSSNLVRCWRSELTQPVRRVPTRTRSSATTANPGDENAHAGLRAAAGKGKLPSTSTSASDARVSGVLGTRKRAALGDLTNAGRARPHEGKDKDGEAKKPALRTRAGTSARAASQLPRTARARVPPAAHEAPEAMAVDAPLAEREPKRARTDVHEVAPAAQAVQVPPRPKDAGWEDLDKDDVDDPLMVAEYVEDIFAYMRKIELQCMPNGNYMSMQRDLNWNLRGVLADWLIETHAKFRLLPETLFLALNVVDRFLSLRTISLSKLQLVGVTALFIAAKYEEVLCPSIQNFLYVADGGYTSEEILRAERYMLKVLNFDLSYASPMNFLRRISKADNYDIQTRTVAKYFMEISLVDHRLLDHPPSLVAAAAVWLAREVLERGEWTPTLVHYSTYAEDELLGTAEIMLDYCLRPTEHVHFYKKYSSKKFMRASAYVVEWAKSTFPHAVITPEDVSAGAWTDENGDRHALDMLRVDLYERHGHPRPSVLPLGTDASSPAASER